METWCEIRSALKSRWRGEARRGEAINMHHSSPYNLYLVGVDAPPRPLHLPSPTPASLHPPRVLGRIT